MILFALVWEWFSRSRSFHSFAATMQLYSSLSIFNVKVSFSFLFLSISISFRHCTILVSLDSLPFVCALDLAIDWFLIDCHCCAHTNVFAIRYTLTWFFYIVVLFLELYYVRISLPSPSPYMCHVDCQYKNHKRQHRAEPTGKNYIEKCMA